MGNIQIQNEQQDKSMQIFVNSWNSFNKTESGIEHEFQLVEWD